MATTTVTVTSAAMTMLLHTSDAMPVLMMWVGLLARLMTIMAMKVMQLLMMVMMMGMMTIVRMMRALRMMLQCL